MRVLYLMQLNYENYSEEEVSMGKEGESKRKKFVAIGLGPLIG